MSLPPPMTYRPRRLLRVFAVLVIFIGGMICGGGLTYVVAVQRIRQAIHHPEQVPPRLTRYLTRQLHLSPDQSDLVLLILQQHQAQLQSIRRQTQPRVQANLEQLRGQIGEILNPDQKPRWNEIFDDAIDRWLPPPPPATQGS